jgi:hypothetical protein
MSENKLKLRRAGRLETPHGRVDVEGPEAAVLWLAERLWTAERAQLVSELRYHIPSHRNGVPCEDCDNFGCTMNCGPSSGTTSDVKRPPEPPPRGRKNATRAKTR